MGQVFAWTDWKADRYPSTVDLFRIKELVRQILEPMDEVLVAFYRGSTLRFDFTLRSDVDFGVVHETNEGEKVREIIRQMIEMPAKPLHVPLHYRLVDNDLARTQFHPWGPTFIRVTAHNGGRIKGDLSWIAVTHRSLEDELSEYLRLKHQEFQQLLEKEAYIGSERAVAKFLQKGLEAGLEVARNMFIADQICNEAMPTDLSRSAVIEGYRHFIPDALVEQLESLLILDEEYTDLLKRQIEARESMREHGGSLKSLLKDQEREYKDFLGNTLQLKIRAQVLPFIRENLMLVHRIGMHVFARR